MKTQKNGMLDEMQSMLICGSVTEGKPLPKGHGRLIDVNEIPIDCDYYDVDNAPTIIEAESEK